MNSSSSSASSLPPSSAKPKRSRRSFNPDRHHYSATNGGRSSMYRGVTRHRWTGRYEAHLWDKDCWNAVQNKKGRQVYLGAYDDEEAAAHTYDLAALKYWGPSTILNFPLNTYGKEYEEMQHVTKEEYLAFLRRRSSGFSRGVSKYRGVARHHHNGRWEARIGRVYGNKYLYLGTYSTQEEAAAAYDLAAIEYKGLNAVTNFDISHYITCPLPPQAPQMPPFHQVPQVAPPKFKFPKFIDPIGQSFTVDDTTTDELPWSLSMELEPNLCPLPDSQIGLEDLEKLQELLSYTGFEDNVACLFEDHDVKGGPGVSGNSVICGGLDGNFSKVKGEELFTAESVGSSSY